MKKSLVVYLLAFVLVGFSNAYTQSPSPTPEPDIDISGRWEMKFTLIHNSDKPNENGPWLTWVARVSHDGDHVRGSMRSGNYKGRFSCNFLRPYDCKNGSMRLEWDEHDWQEFGFTLNRDWSSGNGWANIRFNTGAVHRYEFKIRKLK